MAHYVTEVVLRRSIEGLERDQDNVVAESDIEIVDKKFENGCETGDNFLGQIFRVHVSYSVKGAEALRNISLVVKILDHDQHNGEFLAQMNLYSIESHFYKEILPLLKEITHDRGFGPKCYYTQEEPLRLIVMEDLQASGYFMGERQLGLDYDHCALALEKLASFHAASMVLADRQPELMEGFSNGMCNMSVIVDLFYKGFLDTTIGELEKWKEDDKEFGEIMEKLIKLRENYNVVYNHPFDTKNDPYQVLNHGDIWVNNIMFKSDGKKPVDILFIDFQISLYTSPGYDLNYFLVMSPNLETRTTREAELLEVYREAFNEKLEEYNYNKDFTLTKDLLERVMKQKAIYGFNMMLTVFPAILRDGKEHAGDTTAMFKNADERKRVMQEMFQLDLFVQYLQFHLKKFNRMGIFDVEY